MASHGTRALVIDASVVRAAGGEEATFPTSKHCRDFLMAVYQICHRAVVTSEILAEWKKHASQFARTWRRWMTGRKKVVKPENATDDELRASIEDAASSEGTADKMLKDAHLLEAALAAGLAVVSLDDEARSLFAAAAAQVRRLRRIMWVSPMEDPQRALKWLHDGAPLSHQLTLAHRAEEPGPG